ncbi:thioesterase [Paludicola sp. MB14-C6]|uniref:acyl-[acyl-carrier-protein] thioesterase n=1 Tax=Paludihabitans sp. MB14-C6 TaxID=3070656 RepID=UPI0027DE4F93|nr:acyl-ACP thioesterase domain-containing protein [Paludicola sp. MB14-C6]WMJ21775.1 thioesterase [Paludicola sp. MB14-C6]
MNQGYFTKEIEIEFCDCDNQKRAKIATIMKHMADIAGLAYADKGYSHTWLWEHNFVFLLSRVSIHIDRMPKADEKLVLHTWEHDIKGPLFYRNFAFYDVNETKIIEAATAWVLVNPTTRHIQKPSAFTGNTNLMPEKIVHTIPLSKFKIDEILEKKGTRKIVYSDIDANNHVYNAVYAAIACDFLPQEMMDKKLTDFRINFKQEAILGQNLIIKLNCMNNKTVVIGNLNQIQSFECEFTFDK